MAIANIIACGIGFSPGSVKFIPTRGFISSETPPPVVDAPSLGNLGWSTEEPERPRERKFRKETLRSEIEDLFRDNKDVVLPKKVERQIVQIVAPGSDRIPSGIPIGDLLQSIDQMERLLEILLGIQQQKEDEMLIMLMLA